MARSRRYRGIRPEAPIIEESMPYEQALDIERAREAKAARGPSKVLGGNFGVTGLYAPQRQAVPSFRNQLRSDLQAERQSEEDRREEAAFRRYKDLMDIRRQQAEDARRAESFERDKRKEVVGYYQGLDKTAYERSQAELDRQRQAEIDRRAQAQDEAQLKNIGLVNQAREMEIQKARDEQALRENPHFQGIAAARAGLPQPAGVTGKYVAQPDGSVSVTTPEGITRTVADPQLATAITEKMHGLTVQEWKPTTAKPAYEGVTPYQRGAMLAKFKQYFDVVPPAGSEDKVGVIEDAIVDAMANGVPIDQIAKDVQGITPKTTTQVTERPFWFDRKDQVPVDVPPGARWESEGGVAMPGRLVTDSELKAMTPDLNQDGQKSRDEIEASYQKALLTVQKAEAKRRENPEAYAKLSDAARAVIAKAALHVKAYEGVYKKQAQADIERGMTGR